MKICFLLSLALCADSLFALRQNVRLLEFSLREQETPSDTIVLKADTPVQLRIAETLDTRETKLIEGVEFEALEEVRVGDIVVIKRGAHALGRAAMKQKTSFGRGGTIEVYLLSADAVTGTAVPLRGRMTKEGGSGCFDEGCIGVVLGAKGDDAEIPKGAKIEAHVERDVVFNISAIRKAIAVAEETEMLERAECQNWSTLYVYRMADSNSGERVLSGGESRVYLDGHQVALISKNQFSKLRTVPGKHAIVVGKNKVEFDATPCGEYYVRVSQSGSLNRPRLDLVPNNDGQEQIYPLTAADQQRND